MNKRRVIVLAWVLLPLLAPSAGSEKAKTVTFAEQKTYFSYETEKTFEELVALLRSSGAESRLNQDFVTEAEFPHDSEWMGVAELEGATTDGLSHMANLVFRTPEGAEKKELIGVVFVAHKRTPRKKVTDFLICSMSGKFEKMVTLVSRRDRKGKYISGSAKYSTAKAKKRKARKKFRHELDYWLKGKYRRKQEE